MPAPNLRELQFMVGIGPCDALRLVRRHGMRIRLAEQRRLLQIMFTGLLAKLMAKAPEARQQTTRAADPVFIVGHWRSGTSVLQRLLACDPRFRTPTFLECSFPAARGGLDERFLRRMREKVPASRGFDAFSLALDAEFEDEFALLKLTLDSPMLAYVFPRQGRKLWTDFMQAEPSESWLRALDAFIDWLALPDGRLLLKSPTHAFRMKTLSERYPDSRFIDIRRDAADVFQSTRSLETFLVENNSLQGFVKPDESLILRRMKQHADAVDSARTRLPPERIVSVEFEALHERPRYTVTTLCESLGIAFCPDEILFRAAVNEFRKNRRRWPASSEVREKLQRFQVNGKYPE